MKPFIGLKRLWYGDAFTEAATVQSIKTWMQKAKEVKNVHQNTWSYTQDDANITDYINELTGKTYARDPVDNGKKTIAFTLGEYSLEDRVALQGGSVNGGIWQAPKSPGLIYKAVLAQTKTGNYILFPYASIIVKADTQEKNIGLGVSAVAMENPDVAALAEEYWVDGDTAVLEEVG